MELQEILDLIKQGASEQEVRPLLQDWAEQNPDAVNEVGFVGEAVREAGLSTGQAQTFNKAWKQGVAKGNILDETPATALAGPILGTAGRVLGGTAGRGAVVTAIGEAGETAVKLVNQGILDKIGRAVIRTVIPRPTS